MKVLSLVLAGGSGEELGVLTRHRAKTAVPFGGRYRIIDFCLSNCVNSGITRINVLAQFNPKSLIEHIGMGKPWDLDRKIGGIYIMQPSYNGKFAHWYRGTGDALWQNIETIRNSDAELVLILSGDQVYTMDYRELVERHLSCSKPITIACKNVGPSESRRLGMVKCDKNGIVVDLMEKPRSSDYSKASLGIYLFDREFLLDTLDKNTTDLVFDVIIPGISRRDVAAYEFHSYWEDIGSVPAYYNASARLLDDRSFMMQKDLPLFTRESGLAPTRFLYGSSVEHSIIADGCMIGGKVRDSILFPGVSVERGALVSGSIIFSYSAVRSGAKVERSIIDKLVEIGSGSKIGFPSEPLTKGKVKGAQMTGITILGKGSVISEKVTLPRGIMIEPENIIRESVKIE